MLNLQMIRSPSLLSFFLYLYLINPLLWINNGMAVVDDGAGDENIVEEVVDEQVAGVEAVVDDGVQINSWG